MIARFPRAFVLLLASAASAIACGSPSADDGDASNGAITSNDGVPLEMLFSGEVVAQADLDARQAVVAQLQYTQGILTAVGANGQVGLVTLSDVSESPRGDKKTLKYKASLPVVWPKFLASPERYELALPADLTALSAFNERYDGACGRSEYGRDSFWHDFNPSASGCDLDGGDVVKTTAQVRPHPKTTHGKYPEYDRIWADDTLDVVGVFGSIESTVASDDGARERETFLRQIARTLTKPRRKDNAPSPSIIKDSTLTGTVQVAGIARTVNVTALFIESVAITGPDFDERFGAASAKADLIVYSGHSGLGANINALASKSQVVPGKYQIVYLNGCQSLAYLGTALRDKQIAANGSAAGPAGTKYLDIVANALPAYGDDGATALALYRAMLDYWTRPASYNDLLQGFSPLHLTAAFGEDDNTFQP